MEDMKIAINGVVHLKDLNEIYTIFTDEEMITEVEQIPNIQEAWQQYCQLVLQEKNEQYKPKLIIECGLETKEQNPWQEHDELYAVSFHIRNTIQIDERPLGIIYRTEIFYFPSDQDFRIRRRYFFDGELQSAADCKRFLERFADSPLFASIQKLKPIIYRYIQGMI